MTFFEFVNSVDFHTIGCRGRPDVNIPQSISVNVTNATTTLYLSSRYQSCFEVTLEKKLFKSKHIAILGMIYSLCR